MKNKIIQGDALEELKKLPDESVDMVVTSPPYNKSAVGKRTASSKDVWKQRNISYGEFDDALPEDKYQQKQNEIIKECLRALKDNGSIFYNHKARIVNHEIITPFEWLSDFIIRQLIIWDRGSSPVLEPIRFYPTTEYLFWITKKRNTPKFRKESLFFNKEVWRLSPRVNTNHPAPFPLEIPSNCIKATTDEGEIVLDPYIGIGTTAVAARQLGRNFIGIELNEEYIKIAEERLKQNNLL